MKADADSVYITDYAVTDAAVHDSNVLPELIDNFPGENLFADSAYKSTEIDALLSALNINNNIHEKGCRNHPLNHLDLHLNHLKSKIRSRVEHIVGCFESSMGGPEPEFIGFKRNATDIGLCHLAYNMLQYVRLVRLGRVPAMV